MRLKIITACPTPVKICYYDPPNVAKILQWREHDEEVKTRTGNIIYVLAEIVSHLDYLITFPIKRLTPKYNQLLKVLTYVPFLTTILLAILLCTIMLINKAKRNEREVINNGSG